MTAMSLDFDRSPDGEPTSAADKAPVPPQQAPATTERPSASVPTFTPAPMAASSEPSGHEHAADEPTVDESAETEAAADEPAAGEPTASELTACGSGVAPAWDARRDGVAEAAEAAADRSPEGAAGVQPPADLDGPLLRDADELRASWQRIQAAFVDDPREAVTDAAGLVEHTAQALAGALRLRQRQLRAMWDRNGLPDGVEYADSGGTMHRPTSPDGEREAAADGPDTEQLRVLIQHYRVLFNSLCRP
jgi:hypothetical protein